MATLTELEATVAQLREEADLLRAKCSRYEDQRRAGLGAIDRAYAAGAEALRKALLHELAGDARLEALVRRVQP